VDPSRASHPVFFALIVPGEATGADLTPPLADQLERAAEAGSTRLLVDLRAAGRVGTRGLNALLDARNRLPRREGGIALVLPAELRRFCEASGLDRRFLVAESRLDAARKLGLVAASEPEASGSRGAWAA